MSIISVDPKMSWRTSDDEDDDDDDDDDAQQDHAVALSSSEDERENNKEEWHVPSGDQPELTAFVDSPGPILENLDSSSDLTAGTCYDLLVPNTLLEKIADQTNSYASDQLSKDNSQCAWIQTNKNEIRRFFGLIIWMELVRLPSLSLYWSRDPVYYQTFPQRVMSRNRFEILLQMIYFADNRKCHKSDSFYKIDSLVEILEENFKKYYVPSQDLCIHESLIPFGNRIPLRQYLKQKRYKFGIRLFKLCCGSGYTHSLRVLNGKLLKKKNMLPSHIVNSLCKDLYDKGYTLYTDRWYTSLRLANKLIAKNIHLVGALRPSRRHNPEAVVSKKLNRGEMFALENKNGITVLKFKDTRDILLLSTKHSTEKVRVQSASGPLMIPRVVVDYNTRKPTYDVTDRVNAYHNPVINSAKWYRKVAFELLLNIAVTNAFILYKNLTNQDICIGDFRRELVEHLVECKNEDFTVNTLPGSTVKTFQICLRY